jgi:protein-disulfide isomerase
MSADGTKLPIPVNERDHVRGREDSHVTVVKYGDFECTDCRNTHEVLKKSPELFSKGLRFIYRHFPLFQIHPHALIAAEATEAAAAQGKFWEMHDRIFANPNKLEQKHLHHYAREIGLDVERFDEELNNHVYADQIKRDMEKSLIYGVTGTPTFYINETRYDEGLNVQRMLDYISSLLDKGKS